MTLDPDAVEADLVAYYDGEGDDRLQREVNPRREGGRTTFVASLPAGSRVLEIGSGPGRDARAFLDAGHRYTAIDLSFEHIRRCRDQGAPVARASVRQVPFRDRSFDAVWTMSTLMHVPETAIAGVLGEVWRVLAPGGVLVAGVWGGRDEERTSDRDAETGRPPRLFSRRSDERWRAMLATVGAVETFEVWRYDETDFVYQWAIVRRS